MATHTTRMLIIGSGPAGLSAAIYGARAGMAPIVVQGLQPGGQLTITTDVENYPGFPRGRSRDPWLMQEMQAQAEHVGTRMLWDTIVSVDLSGPPFTRRTGDSGDIYAKAKPWSSPPVRPGQVARHSRRAWNSNGKGVSACATCDGFFYRGKKVVVIGGGNTAVEEALYMTNHSHDVTLIHRRDTLRAEKILQDRMVANPAISTLWHKKVDHFVADPENGQLMGLKLIDTITGEHSLFETEGAFVAIGHAPATELFKDQLELDEGGYIRVEPGTPKTAIPGVFACGDVMDQTYRQAVTAAGTGCMAALDAERYLAEREYLAERAAFAAG